MKFKWKNTYMRRKDFTVLRISKRREDEKYHWDVKLDNEDVHEVQKLKWRLDPKGYPANWTVDRESGENIYIFTFLHRYVVDAAPGTEVTRKNHDLLDCRKDNLVTCDNHSCVMYHSIRANHGFRSVISEKGNWHILAQLPNGREVLVEQHPTRDAAERREEAMRSGKVRPADALYAHKLRRGIGSYIRHLCHTYRVSMTFRGTCLAEDVVFRSAEEAITYRNKCIREWAEKLFEESQ